MSYSPIKGPLSHLTIIDATRVRAGPTAVRFFADLGARVIKIEMPKGAPGADDMIGGRMHNLADSENLHRNKESLTLNLKAPEAIEILKRLVEKADVFIENFRPDVKYRLGIGPDVLRKVNPRLVYASISGFGQDGPYHRRPGFDSIAQGMGGLMSITGKPGDGPMRVGVPIADLCAGHFCALGIMAALQEREQSGEGDWVQTSLLQAQIAMLDFQAAQYTFAGQVPTQIGNEHPTTVPTGVYPTQDGHINVAAIGQTMWKRFCTALDATYLIDDPRFATDPDRIEHRAALNAEIEKLLAHRTSTEWTERLLEAGVPCGPIYRIDEMFADPQVQHLAMNWPMEHPTAGSVGVVAQPVTFERYPRPAQARPGPDQGEHTEAILQELEMLESRIEELKQKLVV